MSGRYRADRSTAGRRPREGHPGAASNPGPSKRRRRIPRYSSTCGLASSHCATWRMTTAPKRCRRESAVTDATGRLATLELRCTTEDALASFDTLPTVAADAIRGRWVGRELLTGHPWDGLLTASGWYGKQFDNAEAVHPLLFRTPSGRIFPVDPGRLPLSLAHRAPVTAVSAARRCLDLAIPLLRARAPKARLRNVEHRNTITAAM